MLLLPLPAAVLPVPAAVLPLPAAAPSAAVFDEAAARATPYKWEQDEEEGTVTLRFAVPPECVKKDVAVKFAPQRLTVSVAGA